MILQLKSTEVSQPRISLDQLGEFPFVSLETKCEILRHQKFPDPSSVPYHGPAFYGMLCSFQSGAFQEDLLRREAEVIGRTRARTPQQVARRKSNVDAIRCLIEMGEEANPAPGSHRLVCQNARLCLGGVIISAGPDIITENVKAGHFALTKLRLARSGASENAADIMLLALLHYGQRQSYEGLMFSISQSRLINCFSRTVIYGDDIGRHRHQQLHQALQEIVTLWPQVQRT